MRWRGVAWMKGVLPRSDLPGAQQPTPCCLNRYALLLTYCFYVCLTGCVYMGWTPLVKMILRAGGYSYLCTSDSSAFLEGPERQQIPGICNAQESAVQKLYTLTLAVHFSSSAVAGALVDFAGPRLTALLGQALSFAGWCVLASTTPTSRYTLPAASILIGLGVDTSVLPHLCITRLFPGSAGLIITITGPGAMFFVALLLLPYKNFVAYDVQTKAVDIPKLEGRSDCSISESRNIKTPNATAGQYPQEERQQEQQQRHDQHQQELHQQELHQQDQQQQHSQDLDQTQQQQQPTTPVQQSGSAVLYWRQEPLPCEISSPGRDSNVGRVDMNAFVSTGESATESSSCGFWRQFSSEQYVLIVLYFVGVVWASSFYQQAPRRAFSTSVVSFLEVMLPISFIPCIVLGKVADVYSIVGVMLGLNTCGVLMYALAMVKKEAAGYASVVFFCLYMSLFMGQIFVYVEGTFSPQHFGKLVGLAAMIGGLLSLVCNLLYEVAVTGGEGGLFICQVTMVSLLLFQFCILGRLYYLFSKNPSPYRASRQTAHPTIDRREVPPIVPQQQQRQEEHQVSEADWASSPEMVGQSARLPYLQADVGSSGPPIEVDLSPVSSSSS